MNMRSHWPELIGLSGKEFSAAGENWTIRHADVLEDQRSSRLALLLDLQRGEEILTARLLFPGETHAVDQASRTEWILASLKNLIESGRLRQDGIYAIA
jgi:hypothetical protein